MLTQNRIIVIIAVPSLLILGWLMHPINSWVSSALSCSPCAVCGSPEYSVRRAGENSVAICSGAQVIAGVKDGKVGLASGLCPSEQVPPVAPAPAAVPAPYQPLPRKVMP